MKVSEKDYWRGKGRKEKKICPKCNRHYEQAIYMIINKKWIKIGTGCPECLPRELSNDERKDC